MTAVPELDYGREEQCGFSPSSAPATAAATAAAPTCRRAETRYSTQLFSVFNLRGYMLRNI